MNIVVFVDGKPYKLVPLDENTIITKTPIEKIFSVRTMKVLEKEGIKNLEEFLFKSEAEILRIPNLGRKSLNEIKEEVSNRFQMRVGQLLYSEVG